VLKLTSPGVADLYQGTELWDLSLVDPDNRHPVDFGARAQYLAAPPDRDAPHELLLSWQDGRIKQYVIHRILELRRRQPALFAAGSYHSVEVEGTHANRVVAFARTHADEMLVAVVPRLIWPLLQENAVPLPLPDRWGNTAIKLPAPTCKASLRDALTGKDVAIDTEASPMLEQLLGELPVSVLTTCHGSRIRA